MKHLKKTFVLFIILITLGFASCSNEQTTPVSDSNIFEQSISEAKRENKDRTDDDSLEQNDNSNGNDDLEEEIPFLEYIETSALQIEKCENTNIDTMRYGYNDGLCAYQDRISGLWGYLDENMNTAIEPVYFEVYPFYEGLAGVYDGYNWGFIDTSGNYVFEPQFYEIVPFEPYHPGFWGGMAIVEDAQNSLLPSWKSENKKYHIIDKDGHDTLIDYETYIDKFYEINYCNGIFCVSELGEDIRLLNTDGTVNHELSAKFQPIVAAKEYSRCSLVRKDSDIFLNYTDNLVVWSYNRMLFLRISDTSGNLMFDLSALREFNQINSLKVCNNVFITKRKINDIEQSAVYDYNGQTIIDYKYKEIIPVCKNGEAIYYVCYAQSYDIEPTVFDNKGHEIKEYLCVDLMKSYDGKDYLFCINKNDPRTADIVEYSTNEVITTFKCDEYLSYSGGKKKYLYAGIYKGILLVSCDKTYVYDYIFNDMKVIDEELESDHIHLDKGVCRSSYFAGEYYKITGFPIDEYEIDTSNDSEAVSIYNGIEPSVFFEDGADLYTAEQEKQLIEEQQKLCGYTGWNIAVITTDIDFPADGHEAVEYAESRYKEIYGSYSADGILYLIDTGYRQFSISGEPDLYYFNDSRVHKMIERCNEKYYDWDDMGNVETYFDCIREFYDDGPFNNDKTVSFAEISETTVATTTAPAEKFITIKGKKYSTSLTELNLRRLDSSNEDIKALDKMTNLTSLDLSKKLY